MHGVNVRFLKVYVFKTVNSVQKPIIYLLNVVILVKELVD